MLSISTSRSSSFLESAKGCSSTLRHSICLTFRMRAISSVTTFQALPINTGGEAGIRTQEPNNRVNALAGRPNRPLWHLSTNGDLFSNTFIPLYISRVVRTYFLKIPLYIGAVFYIKVFLILPYPHFKFRFFKNFGNRTY